MELKSGLKLAGIKPEILLGVMILQELFLENDSYMIITEFTGGQHGINSLHYKGLAVDIRTKSLDPKAKDSILTFGKLRLGKNYDFILEDAGKENEHFHLEFDPKE